MESIERLTGNQVGTQQPPASEEGPREVAHVAARGRDHDVAQKRPDVLIGVKIPTRNRQARRLVTTAFRECSWLGRSDLPAMTRLAELYVAIRRIAERLDRGGYTKADGDPRKLLGEWRTLMAEARQHEAALGLTAAARASLGVDLARGFDLARAMSERTEA